MTSRSRARTSGCDLGDVAPATIARDPLGFLASVAAEDLVRYRTGPWRVVLVNRAAYARQVLNAGLSTYVKLGTPDLQMLTPMLGGGLMTSDGDEWQRQRRLCQPAFRPEELRRFVPLIDSVACAVVERLEGLASIGGPVDISVEMTRATVRVVALCLFGTALGDRLETFASAVDEMNEGIAHFDPRNLGRADEFRRARSVVVRLAREILAEVPATSESLAGIIRASAAESGDDSAAVDQIVTFLMAGHETTAKCLTWTLFLLDQHPNALARTRAEALSVLSTSSMTMESVDTLSYAWCVLQESMRLYPPVWSLTRVCVTGDVIDGHSIDAGSLVVVSPFAMHRDPRHWPNPDRFDPTRFEVVAVAASPNRGFIPFGGGGRSCIGRGLAELELRVLLARILCRLRLRVLEGHVVTPEALVTLRPKGGMPMRLEMAT